MRRKKRRPTMRMELSPLEGGALLHLLLCVQDGRPIDTPRMEIDHLLGRVRKAFGFRHVPEAIPDPKRPATEPPEGPDTVLRVGGSTRSFHCECGGNVFRAVVKGGDKYSCNSCGARYTSSA